MLRFLPVGHYQTLFVRFLCRAHKSARIIRERGRAPYHSERRTDAEHSRYCLARYIRNMTEATL